MNFHYAAYSYLDEYLAIDSPCNEAIENAEKANATDVEHDAARKQLLKFATKYSIVRNFSSALSGETERLQKVWEALLSQQRPNNDQELAAVVEAFVEALKDRYKRNLLSAATKFLWARFKRPVVIYDSLAWEWVKAFGKLKDGCSYADYVREWRRGFGQNEAKIAAACANLIEIAKFTQASDMPEGKLRSLVTEKWFVERAFDHAIMAEAYNRRVG